MSQNTYTNFETLAVRTQTERSQFDEHSTPLYLTSSFVFEDAEDMRASFAEEKDKNGEIVKIEPKMTIENAEQYIQNTKK